jgi:hypothetical protein
MRTSIIRPGLLVALSSTVSGGVQYKRVDLDAPADGVAGDAIGETRREVTRWETTRVIEDPAEHDRAVKARGKACKEIRDICSDTNFGLLCPVDREADLDAAIKRAYALADEHNALAKCTRVAIYTIKGRIASTDEEAARAIGSEVTALLDAMSRGIEQMDVKAIREAATRAADMSAMLGDEQIARVSDAVEQARKAARTIVKRIEKKGENAASVLQDIQRGAIEKARFAFLDLDTPAVEAQAPVENVQRFAELDCEAPAVVEAAPPSGDVAGETPPTGETLAASAV